jgi:hypothetical protein
MKLFKYNQFLGDKPLNENLDKAKKFLKDTYLLTQAATDKLRLIEKLRQYLDETSRQSAMERKSAEADFAFNELSKVPFTIYIG